MSDKFLDHPILSSRNFYPWENCFEKSFFAEGNAVTSAVVNGKPVTIWQQAISRINT